jgi:quercetin dioxygenase-like cupin family protein
VITKRDVLVAVVAVGATLTAVVAGQSGKQVMGSSVFDWSKLEVKPSKVGERRDLFQSPTATLDELESHVTTVNAGDASHAPHKHPDEEMVIVKEGTVEAMVNSQTKTVGAGSVLFFASNEMHGLRNVGKTPATYFVIRWKTAATPKAEPK